MTSISFTAFAYRYLFFFTLPGRKKSKKNNKGNNMGNQTREQKESQPSEESENALRRPDDHISIFNAILSLMEWSKNHYSMQFFLFSNNNEHREMAKRSVKDMLERELGPIRQSDLSLDSKW